MRETQIPFKIHRHVAISLIELTYNEIASGMPPHKPIYAFAMTILTKDVIAGAVRETQIPFKINRHVAISLICPTWGIRLLQTRPPHKSTHTMAMMDSYYSSWQELHQPKCLINYRLLSLAINNL